MRTRKVIVLSLISAGAAFLFSGCPAQPPSPCVIAHAGGSPANSVPGNSYVVQYYLNTDAGFGPSAGCTNAAGIAAYGYWPSGDFVGGLFVESYGAVISSNKLVGMVPEEFGWTNTYIGDYVQGSPRSLVPIANDPVIYGNFTTDTQAASGTCLVLQQADAGSTGVQTFVPIGAPGPQTVTYRIPVFNVYTNQAGGEGTQAQFVAQITRDDGTGNPCVRNYIGIALWPGAVCAVDNDCNPNPQPSFTPPRPLGSGILPGIPVTCNTTLANNDPIIVPANIPFVPTVACTKNGAGTDSCAAGVCSNLTATAGAPPVACTVAADGTDSCAPSATSTSTEACLTCDATGCSHTKKGASGTCGTIAGVCATPYLDAFGCSGPAPYINQSGGCGGPAKDNNGTGATGICFYPNPSPLKFPYLP